MCLRRSDGPCSPCPRDWLSALDFTPAMADELFECRIRQWLVRREPHSAFGQVEAGECVSRGVDCRGAEWKDTEVVARDSEAQQRATPELERGHPVADRLFDTRHGTANDVSDPLQLRSLILRNAGEVVVERSH